MAVDDGVEWTGRLLGAVTDASRLFVDGVAPAELFGGLLGGLLELTESDYGYIAEVLYDESGAPYLKTWAITNIAWDDTTRAMYEEHVVRGEGLEFRNLDTLFGWGIREGGRLVIANDTGTDQRASSRPDGHPPLDSYLGVPVFRGAAGLVGQFGVSNRPGGYDEALVERLEPFVVAVGNLIDAYRAHTRRRQAEAAQAAAERRHTAIVENLHDIVTILGPDGSWVSSSPAGGRVLGYPPGIDPEGGVFALVHPDDTAIAADALAEVMAGTRGPASPIDLRVADTAGRYRILETAAVDLRDDPAVAGILLTSRDVTDTRQAERLKTDFVATVSHELRTPLTAIVGFAELLVEDTDGTDGGANREYIEIISRNAAQLLGLVGDLLLIARLESGVVDLDRVEVDDTGELLRRALAGFAPEVKAKGVTLSVTSAAGLRSDGPVYVDVARFDQVIANLVSNAVKFTPAGGRVDVTARRAAGGWVFSVADTGIGIPPGELDRMTDRFFRASNARLLEVPGTGLGLATVKAIVDLHGGTVSFASPPDGGTTVTVRFPDRQEGLQR